MIREDELPLYIQCIAEELSGPIRADVGSDYSRKVIDAIVLVLNRLRTQSETGRAKAGAARTQWDALVAGFDAILPEAAGATAPQEGADLTRLDGQLSGIQAHLLKPENFDAFVAAATVKASPAKKWMRDASEALRDMLQGLEDGIKRPGGGRQGAPAAADDLPGLRTKLGAYLHARYPSLAIDPIITLTLATGGQIKRTALFQLAPNDALPTRLVLRQDMPFNFTGTTVTDEFETLARVHALGMPVPQPLMVEPDADILGGPFMIMTEVADALPAGTYFPEERAYLGSTMGPDFGHDVAGALAKLHSLTRDGDVEAGRRSEAKRSTEIAAFKEKWRQLKKPALSLVADLGLTWLVANPLPDDRPRCLTHGDVGAHNMMTRDGRLAALLDWELSVDGDPAEDLAQAKMMLLEDVMPWPQFKESYIAQGGAPEACDDHAIAYFSIWTYLRHLALNVQLYEYFMAGERDDAPAASIASHYMDRLMLYEARAVASAMTVVP